VSQLEVAFSRCEVLESYPDDPRGKVVWEWVSPLMAAQSISCVAEIAQGIWCSSPSTSPHHAKVASSTHKESLEGFAAYEQNI